MNALSAIWAYCSSHGTRILGVAQGTVALLCGMGGLIPESHLKYWLAASAVLTYWRGQSTSNTVNQARAIVAGDVLPSPQPQTVVKP